MISSGCIEGEVRCEWNPVVEELLTNGPMELKFHFPPRKVWKFPVDRFCIYEPSDEAWCRPLGIGEEIEVEESMTFPSVLVERVGPEDIKFTVLSSEGLTYDSQV